MPENLDNSSKIIVGLTGPTCAGKGTVLSMLKREGFLPMSTSDFVRREVRDRGLPAEQPHLHNIAYEMISRNPSILATKAIGEIRIAVGRLFAIDGIRTIPTIVRLKERKGVIIVGVTASRECLVERIFKRARPGDPKTNEEATRFLDREWGKDEPPHGYQVGPCVTMADEIIENSGTLAELEKKVLDFCKRIKSIKP